jgi:hypothetical protein
MAWQAGAAEVVITPPVGGEMDGYGARRGGSTGVHDDLPAILARQIAAAFAALGQDG